MSRHDSGPPVRSHPASDRSIQKRPWFFYLFLSLSPFYEAPPSTTKLRETCNSLPPLLTSRRRERRKKGRRKEREREEKKRGGKYSTSENISPRLWKISTRFREYKCYSRISQEFFFHPLTREFHRINATVYIHTYIYIIYTYINFFFKGKGEHVIACTTPLSIRRNSTLLHYTIVPTRLCDALVSATMHQDALIQRSDEGKRKHVRIRARCHSNVSLTLLIHTTRRDRNR